MNLLCFVYQFKYVTTSGEPFTVIPALNYQADGEEFWVGGGETGF